MSGAAGSLADRSHFDPRRRREIAIVAHDPSWPLVFTEQAARIAAALGEAALGIAHVGSTAVPGLAAKPVIDIHLAVKDSADEEAYGPALETIGFRLAVREPDWFEHRLYQASAPDINLHVFSQDCRELARCRLFRDWLRVDRADRALYGRVKSTLASLSWDSVDDYAAAKQSVIDDIMARAHQRIG